MSVLFYFVCAEEVWKKIHDVIIKTIISVESKIMTAMDMFVPFPG